MDEAARRLMPAQLAAMVRCREVREEKALQQLHDDRREFESAMALEQRALEQAVAAEQKRNEVELGIYEGLHASGPLAPWLMEERRVAIADLTARIAEAARAVEDAREDRLDAEGLFARSRREHAMTQRDTTKWRNLDEQAAGARRRHADDVEELELEDQALIAFAARQRGEPQ